MADKKLQQLIINKGTEAKFNALPVKSDEQLYFITDSNTYVTTDQGMDNAGKILTVGADGKLFPEVKEWLPKSGGVLTGPIIASEHAEAVYVGVDVLQLRADTDSVIGTPASIKVSPNGGMRIYSSNLVQFASSVAPTDNVRYDLGSSLTKWRYI